MSQLTRNPGDWIPGYSYDSDTIAIDRTALPEAHAPSAAEAAAATGDIGKVLLGILEGCHQHSQSVPLSQRPVNFRITKAVTPNTSTGVLSKAFTVRIECLPEGLTVVPEPVEE